MAFAQHDLAPKSWDLGKYVLLLATLGIFSKLLRIDLSQIDVLGVRLGAGSVMLIPGFVGLALFYVLAAFILARLENFLALRSDVESKALVAETLTHPPLRWFLALVSPLAFVVYSMPYALGGFACWYLWSDAIAVLRLIFRGAA